MSVLQSHSKMTKSSTLELDQEEEAFNIASPVEIQFILNAIMEEKSAITLHLERSNQFILSTILAMDPVKRILIMDYGTDEILNQLVQRVGSLRCITSQNRIRIEFHCTNLTMVQFEGRAAFRVDIPANLLRIQRRNFYRIMTPITNSATCSIPLPQKKGKETALFNLSDISCGGIALIDSHAEIKLTPGTVFENCQLDLPQFGIIVITIQVRSIYTTLLKNGDTSQRAGCEFIELPEKSRALIQRYITRLEQQMRQFTSDDEL